MHSLNPIIPMQSLVRNRIAAQFNDNLMKGIPEADPVSVSAFNNIVSQLRYLQQLLEHCHIETKSEPKHRALGDAYNSLHDLKDSIMEQTKGATGMSCGEVAVGDLPQYSSALCDIAANMLCAVAAEIQGFARSLNLLSIDNLAQDLWGVASELKFKLSLDDSDEVEKGVEDGFKKDTELGHFATLSIQSFCNDLTKAFIIGDMSFNDLEKAMKDVSHLEKKVITNKQGHKQTVYVRHHSTGEKHEFKHGDTVSFEHKGKQVKGTIHNLKHHEVFDKFGTAHIKDAEGNTYSKSLRNLSHHSEQEESFEAPDKWKNATREQKEEAVRKYLDEDDVETKPESKPEYEPDYERTYNNVHDSEPKLTGKNAEKNDYGDQGDSKEEMFSIQKTIPKVGQIVRIINERNALISNQHLYGKEFKVVGLENTGLISQPSFLIVEDESGTRHSINPDFVYIQPQKVIARVDMKQREASKPKEPTPAPTKEPEIATIDTPTSSGMSQRDEIDLDDINSKLERYKVYRLKGTYPHDKYENKQEFNEDIDWLKKKKSMIQAKYKK